MSKTLNQALGRALIVAGCLGVAAAGSLWAQAYARVAFTVVDEEGKKIVGAKVTATCAELTLFEEIEQTNKRGIASFAFADGTKVYDFKIEKEGYRTDTFPLKPELRVTTQREIVLRKLGTAAPVVEEEGDEKVSRRFTPAEKDFNAAVEALRADDAATAKAKLLEALEKDPNLAAAHAALGGIYLQQYECDLGLASAAKALELNPQSTVAYRVLYECHRSMGNAEEAQAALDRMAELDPSGDTAVMVYNAGVEAFKQERLEEAKGQFQLALKLNPDLGPAMNALGTILLGEQKYAEALVLGDRLVAAEPGSAPGQRIRYAAYKGLGDEAKAQEAFDALKTADPKGIANEIYNEGVRLFNANKIREAIEQYELVVEIDPERADAHYQLGLSYSNTGNNAKAREHLEKFIAMAPEDANAEVARSMLDYLGQ